MYPSRNFSEHVARGYMLGDGTSQGSAGRIAMAFEVVAETRRRFTRKEYYRLAEAGILAERERVELIRGDIIPEYWVVDCAAETVEVHRGPGPEGYRDVSLVAGVATLTMQAFPDVELRTTDIFA
jgi:hypothetical protein